MDPTVAPTPLQISVLGNEPHDVICPSCNRNGLTIVREEASTFSQRMVSIFEKCCCCKCCWRCSKDLNHYCCHCGCFIGRYIDIGYFQEKTLKKHKTNSKRDRFDRMIDLPQQPQPTAEQMNTLKKETAF